MAKQQLVLLVTLVAVAVVATVSAADTAYDVLVKNNLPRGLLPAGVASYNLQSDGTISVRLPSKDCIIPVKVLGQAYSMRFGQVLGGVIKPGSISEAHGVRIQVQYAWLPITSVNRAGDQINLSVQGGNPLSFPVSSFASSVHCT